MSICCLRTMLGHQAAWHVMGNRRPCGSARLTTPSECQATTGLVTRQPWPMLHVNTDAWHFTKELGKCKLKPQWNISVHLSGWLKRWQHQVLMRMRRNQTTHTLLVGMRNGIASVEGSLAVSCETINQLHSWAFIPEKRKPGMCSNRKSILHKCP